MWSAVWDAVRSAGLDLPLEHLPRGVTGEAIGGATHVPWRTSGFGSAPATLSREIGDWRRHRRHDDATWLGQAEPLSVRGFADRIDHSICAMRELRESG